VARSACRHVVAGSIVAVRGELLTEFTAREVSFQRNRIGVTENACTDANGLGPSGVELAQRKFLPFVFAGGTGADQGDRFVTILCVQLFHDPVNVILDGEFGQIQVGGDFFVALAHGDERHQLALPLSEFQSHAGPLFLNGGFLGGLAGDSLEKYLAESWGADGFALCNQAHGVGEFCGRCTLQDIPVDAQAYRLKEDVGVLIHSKQHHFEFGNGFSKIADQII
jgi:hypothetical protein